MATAIATKGGDAQGAKRSKANISASSKSASSTVAPDASGT